MTMPAGEAQHSLVQARTCLTMCPAQAHTNVDVRVDINAMRALLADRLPLVFAGWPVEAAALPWPVQEGAEEAEAAEAAADEAAEAAAMEGAAF